MENSSVKKTGVDQENILEAKRKNIGSINKRYRV